jgi:cytochrome c556
MRKLVITGMAVAMLAIPAVASADKPESVSNPHAASVNNTNANSNACWGQDRSFYASETFFADNMDIKQSFPTELGTVSAQRAAWVAQYCG